MIDQMHISKIDPGPQRRHDARVRRVSSNPRLLFDLDRRAVDETGSMALVNVVCLRFDVPVPRLYFHARRSPYTGATDAPRSLLVDRYGARDVERAEQHRGKSIDELGVIRLGRSTTLMTLAHELGHHLVFALDPVATPAHGAVWIGRFDQAAQSIQSLILDSSAGALSRAALRAMAEAER